MSWLYSIVLYQLKILLGPLKIGQIGCPEMLVTISLRGWLKHCSTSWKVGSIPDGVVEIFH
jgi:hypothetical protein